MAALPDDPVFDAIVSLLGKAGAPGVWDFANAKLVYENETDGAPSGKPAPWVLVLLESTLYGQQSVGSGADIDENRWDEDGRLWFHVFVPRGTGIRTSRNIAKALAQIFRGRTLLNGQLEFLDADLGAGDPGRENGNYHLTTVGIDWRVIDAT